MLEIEATVVPGFEAMAKEEITEKLGAEEVKLSRGRVNFHISEKNLLDVLILRSVDNLYFIVNRFENVLFTKDKDESLQRISNLVNLVDWKGIIDTWQRFFTFNEPINYSEILRIINQLNTTQLHSLNNHSGGEVDIESSNDDQLINEFLNVEKESCINSLVNNIEKKNFESKVGEKFDRATNSLFMEMDLNSDAAICENKKSFNDTDNLISIDKTEPRKVKERTLGMPSYRVTCNRNGNHAFQSPMVACEFGGVINDLLKWNVSLDNFDLEIMLIINENEVKVGTGLTAKSLHRRDLVKFGKTSLRPTIAYGMLRLCRPRPGEIICDPMCGCGSIPIEAAISYEQCFHLAGDIDILSIERTGKNISSINRNRNQQNLGPLLIDAFNWDSGRLPFKDNSIDVFITDLPFGKRVGSHATNWKLYPHVLLELARISKLDRGRACLLTQDRKCIQNVINKFCNLWKRGPTVVTNIGGLTAAVFILYRTANPFNSNAIIN